MCASLGWFLIRGIRERSGVPRGPLCTVELGAYAWSVNTTTYCRVTDRAEPSPCSRPSLHLHPPGKGPRSRVLPCAPARPSSLPSTHARSRAADGATDRHFWSTLSITMPSFTDENTGSARGETVCPRGLNWVRQIPDGHRATGTASHAMVLEAAIQRKREA